MRDELADLRRELEQFVNPEKAKFLQRFFRTDDNGYGRGDVFKGISVPQSRAIAKKYRHLSLGQITLLLHSIIHEERLVALFILVDQFSKSSEQNKTTHFHFYLSNTHFINNWDLVDSSADKIVGAYLLDKDWQVLINLAKSESIWEKRIAMIATYQFLKVKKDPNPTVTIAELLLDEKHDLIQKAVGWMLRELGKRVSKEKEELFLDNHYRKMGRTALRYAIEHFPEPERQAYLKGTR